MSGSGFGTCTMNMILTERPILPGVSTGAAGLFAGAPSAVCHCPRGWRAVGGKSRRIASAPLDSVLPDPCPDPSCPLLPLRFRFSLLFQEGQAADVQQTAVAPTAPCFSS